MVCAPPAILGRCACHIRKAWLPYGEGGIPRRLQRGPRQLRRGHLVPLELLAALAAVRTAESHLLGDLRHVAKLLLEHVK